MDAARLKKALADRNITVEAISVAIGIDPSTYYRKMNSDGETFTLRQAKKIVSELKLSSEEASEIFFG